MSVDPIGVFIVEISKQESPVHGVKPVYQDLSNGFVPLVNIGHFFCVVKVHLRKCKAQENEYSNPQIEFIPVFLRKQTY